MVDFAPSWEAATRSFVGIVALGLVAWVASVWRRDASLADRFWPGFMATAACVDASLALPLGARGAWMLALASIWAARLCVFITWRNWGHGEDRRYAAMRAEHGESFAWQSLYLVFGLQAVLAWIISLPLLIGIGSAAPLTVLDATGVALAAIGIVIEAIADAQMARFRGDPATRGQVMDRGLWAYSRHPNYFGEACVWWGLALMACAACPAWSPWTLVALLSPVLMTWLLLRISGVSLLEKDIADRRPGYREYVARTNAFLPGPRRKAPTP
ncbi:MAG TPA: DUF1295 domain-containing protein [Burkholderiaceae bacterium]|nr:DUF1295 domain-containing protein [Burkholderiaceae bacterium]